MPIEVQAGVVAIKKVFYKPTRLFKEETERPAIRMLQPVNLYANLPNDSPLLLAMPPCETRKLTDKNLSDGLEQAAILFARHSAERIELPSAAMSDNVGFTNQLKIDFPLPAVQRLVKRQRNLNC